EFFPEVFAQGRGGFDAGIGNPPWETNNPSSREFFARPDADFSRLSKQAAIVRQQELCEDAAIAAEWEQCLQEQKDQSRFFREHYSQQGVADLNAYKLFLERSHELLRDGGRLAVIVPGAIYSDRGSRALRELFLDHCRWEWLFAFENRERIFPIDSRFKFCVLILSKGGQTENLRCAFMQRPLANWQAAEDHSMVYTPADLQSFSPRQKVLLELTHERDKSVLGKIHAAGQSLAEPGQGAWDLQYGREFDTTLDSALFPPRPQWESKGYRQSMDGRWRSAEQGDEALPLYEGRMIAAFSSRAKGWVSGRGRRARWEELAGEAEGIGPQFLMAAEDYRRAKKACPGPRIAFMRIASATNERSMIATYLARVPMADSLFYLRPGDGSLIDCLAAICILNSFCFDFQVRRRLGGLNMSWFMLSETVLPDRQQAAAVIPLLAGACARLALQGPMFATEAKELLAAGIRVDQSELGAADRQDLRASIEALVARLYGLDGDDFAWILRDCAHPVEELKRRDFQRTLDPKGFWRVDRELPPEERLSKRSLTRFQDLEEQGIDAFMAGVSEHG
ncbi:MAG: Eco57I restriction-modification methylase domain-containing protein, partial [Planctomycetota bacterium]